MGDKGQAAEEKGMKLLKRAEKTMVKAGKLRDKLRRVAKEAAALEADAIALAEKLGVGIVRQTQDICSSIMLKLVHHGVPGAIPYLLRLAQPDHVDAPRAWRICSEALLDLVETNAEHNAEGLAAEERAARGVGIPAIQVLGDLANLPDPVAVEVASDVLLRLTKSRGAGQWIVRAGAMHVLAGFKRNPLLAEGSISVSNSVYIAHLSDAELKAWRDRVRQNCAHAMKILSRGASGGSQGRREILNTGGVAVLTKLLRD